MTTHSLWMNGISKVFTVQSKTSSLQIWRRKYIWPQLTARHTISPTKPDLVGSVTKLYSTLHLFYCYDNSLNTNIGTDSNVLSGKNKYEQMSSYISDLKKNISVFVMRHIWPSRKCTVKYALLRLID